MLPFLINKKGLQKVLKQIDAYALSLIPRMDWIYLSGLVGLMVLTYSYVVYPVLMWVIWRVKSKGNCECRERSITPQEVAVVMAVHNEERFIKERLEQILNSHYGRDVLIAVGSDGSTDSTNEILEKFSEKYDNVSVFFFPRQGKASTINRIMEKLPEEIKYVILTDVKTLADDNAIPILISALISKEKIGVAMPWVKTTHSDEGLYFDLEIRLKCYESEVFGFCAGAFGNMYALRRDMFRPIPSNFLVDDLFVSIEVVRKGGQIKVCRNTASYVAPTTTMKEFARRRRIATGNWQIVKWMMSNITKFPFAFVFVFLSHKVLRWLGPLWIILIFIALLKMGFQNPFLVPYMAILGFVVLLVRPMRALALRFLVLNMAMLFGLYDFFFKKQRGMWEPTDRQLSL